MRILDQLRTVPQNVYVLVFSGIFLVSSLSVYFLSDDVHLLDRKIQSRQKDYGEVLQLRDAYESKKHALEKAGTGKVERRPLTLGLVEEIVTKSFMGGKLSQLRPAGAGQEGGAKRMAVEVKVDGAPLGEVVSFVKATAAFGLYVGKLRLSMSSANPSALDMQATVMERQVNG